MAFRKAKLSERVVVTDKVTKEELHRDEKNSAVCVESEEKPGRPMVGHARLVDSVRVSFGFQSVESTVGLELPFYVSEKTVRQDTKKAFELAEELVADKLAEKAAGLDGLVRDLAKKYGR